MVLGSTPARAQGGPPFRTDDPDTPGNKLWEINTILIGERNPSGGAYAMPNLDLNYGLGSRIQLKYEIPLALQETRGDPWHFGGGLGNSLMGLKWRFYAHHPRSERGRIDKKDTTFGLSVYPQLLLNNPTSSLRRNIVEAGPQFLLPLEANAKIGPLRISGEYGYWFTSKNVPNTWIRGIIVGHEFENKKELYLEISDQEATKGIAGETKPREATMGLGFRSQIIQDGSVWLIGMGGRSLVRVTPTNGEPTWIASIGLQFLTGKHQRNSSDQ